MEKRYQVFVSSTYADLKEERQRVIQTLMEMDCIPAGMELFPATDEDQFEFIKSIIDDCDYYLVIIGGRYGSLDSEGISYTEKEYDYAVNKGLKIVALLHETPEEISVKKSDIDIELRKKLDKFRTKISDGRLVKFWSKPEDLPGLVALSITQTIKRYPAVGWVRANLIASEEILTETNELRKKNDDLSFKLSKLETKPKNDLKNLAQLDEEILIRGNGKVNGYRGAPSSSFDWEKLLTWETVFKLIAPHLLEPKTDALVKMILRNDIVSNFEIGGFSHEINDYDFQTIKIHLKALDLINLQHTATTTGTTALFWTLTPNGERLMIEKRAISSKKA